MSRARVKDMVYLIQRRDTGERCQFVGDPRLKPKGWRVVRCLGFAMYGDGSGLAY
jgi:hypothetical protein